MLKVMHCMTWHSCPCFIMRIFSGSDDAWPVLPQVDICFEAVPTFHLHLMNFLFWTTEVKDKLLCEIRTKHPFSLDWKLAIVQEAIVKNIWKQDYRFQLVDSLVLSYVLAKLLKLSWDSTRNCQESAESWIALDVKYRWFFELGISFEVICVQCIDAEVLD